MKTKLYRKWIECVAKQGEMKNKSLYGKFFRILDFLTWKPIKDFRHHLVRDSGIARIWWRSDNYGQASAFKKKYAKYSRRYYDSDNVLKRIINTGNED